MGQCGGSRDCTHLRKVNKQNFEIEFKKRKPFELKKCAHCGEEGGQDSKGMGLCLICAYGFCNVNPEPTHARRHFLQNRSHFMFLLDQRTLFCFRCNLEVNSSDPEAKKLLDSIFLLFKSVDFGPSPIIQSEEEIILEKSAGKPRTQEKEVVQPEPQERAELPEKIQGIFIEKRIEFKEEESLHRDSSKYIAHRGSTEQKFDSPTKKENDLLLKIQNEIAEYSPRPNEDDQYEVHSLNPRLSSHHRDSVNSGRSSPFSPAREINGERSVIENSKYRRDSPSMVPKLERNTLGGSSVIEKGARNSVTRKSPRKSRGVPIHDPFLKIRGLKAIGNTSYINCIMQCLYASRVLVSAYINPRNKRWIETPFNRRLAEFFVSYHENEGPIEALPFVEEALMFKEKKFNYMNDNDPTVAIEKIFNALIFSHAKVVRESRGLSADALVKPSSTFIGRFITSVIHTRAVCQSCSKVDWITHEVQLFPISDNAELSDKQVEGKLKYELEVIEGKERLVPTNISFKNNHDVISALVSSMRNVSMVKKYCPFCQTTQDSSQEHFLNKTPELLIVKVQLSGKTTEKIFVNPLLFLDDVWSIDNALLLNKSVAPKVLSMPSDAAQSCFCGYELFALVAKRVPGLKPYTAYVKYGECWNQATDEEVLICDEETVMRADPYLIFYRKTIDLLF